MMPSSGALCMPLAILTIRQQREVIPRACGNPNKGNPFRGLSPVMGNYHARFLGEKGAVTPLTYPVWSRT